MTRRRREAGWLLAAGLCVALPACAGPGPQGGAPLPRADFHAVCPFTMAAPSALAVRDAERWRGMLAASRTVPPPYEAGGTNFRREWIVVVALVRTSTPITEAALAASDAERFDEKTGTLTLRYDVRTRPLGPGEVGPTVVGEPCLVTWVASRKDVLQIVARTTDGRYLGGTRVAEKPKKKPVLPVS